MIDRKISVHLQDFPDVSFFEDETSLIADMDLVREVCSTALSIRDHNNLRVRLPLKSLTVIGGNCKNILPFKEIIADEVNVKSVEIKEEISDLAELKLQINFKKIGAKFGSKIKGITQSAKENNWKKISENEVEIFLEGESIKLSGDDFEIKLIAKNQDDKKFISLALPSNECLVQLDVEVTKELEDEGIARDVVRAIQQNRKEANLNITDRIALKIFSENQRVLSVAKDFENYIKEQVLASEIKICSSKEEAQNSSFFFSENQLDDANLAIGFSR